MHNILELKTINDGGFTGLSFNGPAEYYIWQVQLYMHLLGLKIAYLVYVNKSTSGCWAGAKMPLPVLFFYSRAERAKSAMKKSVSSYYLGKFS